MATTITGGQLIDQSKSGGSRLYTDTNQTYTYISSLDPAGGFTDHYHNSNSHKIQTQGVDRLAIDSAGRVTMPYQPAFYAHGNGAVVTYQQNTAIEFPVTSHNIGNHYNTSSSTFTAPVGGVYHFTMNLYPKGPVQLSVTPMINNVVITGGSNDCEILFTGANGVGSDYTISWSRSVYLNANDTFNFKARPGYADNQIYMGHSKMSGHFVG